MVQLRYGGHTLRELDLSQSIAPDSIQWVSNTLTIATSTIKDQRRVDLSSQGFRW